ncbi:hypothetical protein [Priestia megaterium]|uniref:hypothetical protein n=1 Tax=Priestia megaterium TaxID=1404 RepID=UPI000BFCBA4E|nr:hypothetical protein [Priestia megaterium]PGQ88305.1 hypothetical protein COA18_05085 [Priestia megaterium]
MNETEHSFQGHQFLEKEAANPGGLLRTLRNGKFTKGPADVALDSGKINRFSEGEIADEIKRNSQKGGTGSFAADGALWLGKKVKGAKEPIERAVGAFSRAGDKVDNYLGSFAAGKNPNSWRGRAFSKQDKNRVAQHTSDDGEVTDLFSEKPKASLVAPIEKTVKFTTPFLATAYVADKLYPEQPKDLGENVNQATYENQLQKTSSLFDNSISDRMDKIASMQKIAELEDLVEKYAEDLEAALLDKKATAAQLEDVMMEKVSMEKRATEAEQNFLQKQAEHEELRLRMIAQKRSKIAVDLAEDMLEAKLIKQAQYEGTIDKLMECDEGTMQMYESLVKEARTGSDCLETLSYFGEYKNNEKLAAPHDLARSGLSRRGQTMAEAARDLKK